MMVKQTTRRGRSLRPYAEVHERLVRNGYSPIPLRGKRPVEKAWTRFCVQQAAPATRERFARSAQPYDVAVACGFNGLVGLDVDTDDAAIAEAIRGVVPLSTVAKRGAKGRTDFYRDPTDTVRPRKFAGPSGMLAEILATGNQTVVPPSVHPETGKPYAYLTPATLLNTRVEELPAIPDDIAERLEAALRPWLARPVEKAGPQRKPLVGPPEAVLGYRQMRRQRSYCEEILRRELLRLAEMAPNSGRNRQAFALACRVGRWAHHGVVTARHLRDLIFAACEANLLVAEDGPGAVLATIESGLARAAHDHLPDLEVRRG